MAKFILLHLFLLLAGAGLAKSHVALIGGGSCQNLERIHQVWVFEQVSSMQGFCGGTLIHEKWVLTASHCYNKTAGGTISVWAGVHPYREFQKFNTKSDDIHVYDETEKTGDIMLIKLPGAVSRITPAKLPASPCQTPANGEVLQLAGHGSSVNPDGPHDLNQPLQCLDLEVTDCLVHVTNFFCGEGLKWKPAAYVCNGDSGGGWLKKVGTTDVIYGVLRSNYKHCVTNSRFTSVCADPIRKWINDIMINH